MRRVRRYLRPRRISHGALGHLPRTHPAVAACVRKVYATNLLVADPIVLATAPSRSLASPFATISHLPNYATDRRLL